VLPTAWIRDEADARRNREAAGRSRASQRSFSCKMSTRLRKRTRLQNRWVMCAVINAAGGRTPRNRPLCRFGGERRNVPNAARPLRRRVADTQRLVVADPVSQATPRGLLPISRALPTPDGDTCTKRLARGVQGVTITNTLVSIDKRLNDVLGATWRRFRKRRKPGKARDRTGLPRARGGLDGQIFCFSEKSYLDAAPSSLVRLPVWLCADGGAERIGPQALDHARCGGVD